jgi:hypothetical protein
MQWDKIPSQAVGALLQEAIRDVVWDNDDYEAMLRHQLRAPLLLCLRSEDEPGAGSDPVVEPFVENFRTMQQVLEAAQPPLELLKAVKQFAKGNVNGPAEALPRPIATVLYYAPIAAARVRLATRISQLSDASLDAGFRWALDQPWLVPPITPLLEQGLAHIRQ